MALPLEGKVAVVTGSSRGIGKGIARNLAQDGADVVIIARTAQAGAGQYPGSIDESIAMVQDYGRRAIGVQADVTQDADLQKIVDEALAAFGRIDILVNNAALTGNDAREDDSPAVLDAFYRLNVHAPYALTQLVLPHMKAVGGGVVVNMSTGAARNPSPPTAEGRRGGGGGGAMIIYGVSKAALDRYSTGLAADLFDQNITVITMNPGFVATEKNTANPRPGQTFDNADTPDVPGKAVAFVCRDPMTYTGQILTARRVLEENGVS